MRKKLILFVCTVLVFLFVLTGCSQQNVQQEVQTQTFTYEQNENVTTMFFDLTVNSAQKVQSYEDFILQDENYELVLINITIKNNFASDIIMADSDFTIQYGEQQSDISYAFDALNEKMMPLQQTLSPSQQQEYELLFPVIKGEENIKLCYTDIYIDDEGQETTGDAYCILLNL